MYLLSSALMFPFSSISPSSFNIVFQLRFLHRKKNPLQFPRSSTPRALHVACSLHFHIQKPHLSCIFLTFAIMSIFTAAAYAQFAAKCRRNTGESAATGTNESTLSFMAPPSSPSSSGSTTPESKDPPESYFLDVKITPLDNLVRRPNPKIPFREPPWGPPGFLYPVRRQAPNQRELERLFLHRTQKPGLYDFTELPPLHRHKMYAEIYDTNALYGGTDEPTMAQRITAAKIAKHKKEFDELMMSRDLFAHGPACRADRVSALRQRMAEEDREKRTRADTSRELKESDLFSPITPEVIQKRKEEDRVHSSWWPRRRRGR